MRVKCKTNVWTELPRDLQGWQGASSGKPNPNLLVGQEYVVYALLFMRGHVWYYIKPAIWDYPIYFPGPLFDVTAPSLPRHWVFGFDHNGHPLLAWREWVEDVTFYEQLANGEEAALAVWRSYKAHIDEDSRDTGAM